MFGTGQVGHLLVAHLVAAGHEVIAVNRGGTGRMPGARVVGGDATNPAFTTSVCAGADAVYFCLNATHYGRWAQQFPPLQRGVLTGAASADARLVVLDNLYSYGHPSGPLVETMAATPTSEKAATRAAMTEELLRAHRAGRVKVAIGRASDYFGPGATHSALGEAVFGAALAGTTAQVMGDPDQPHSYSYTPDIAAALAVLATADNATGQIWHLPVANTCSTRELIEQIYRLAGHRTRVRGAGRGVLRAIGLIRPDVREYLHTLYQFTHPWTVDDTAFRSAFDSPTTPLEDALATTMAWFARRTVGPAPSAGRPPGLTPIRRRRSARARDTQTATARPSHTARSPHLVLVPQRPARVLEVDAPRSRQSPRCALMDVGSNRSPGERRPAALDVTASTRATRAVSDRPSALQATGEEVRAQLTRPTSPIAG